MRSFGLTPVWARAGLSRADTPARQAVRRVVSRPTGVCAPGRPSAPVAAGVDFEEIWRVVAAAVIFALGEGLGECLGARWFVSALPR
jgi:hypothetical protein